MSVGLGNRGNTATAANGFAARASMACGVMKLRCDLAANLSEGRRLLKQKRFDVCLTDLNLPDGSGLELVAHINEHYPQFLMTIFAIAD